ncbi:MAG TPA: hypothetical protein VHP83_07570 [Aggregatilineaceae bacterium]|nr:hypothetical protein [Aggregatilineaceae bacterium]
MAEERLASLIQTHLARYPHMELFDVYKLLHQATFGPGHAITNKKAAREYLDEESAKAVSTPPREPLLENIHPDGLIMRLHLRPYLAYRGSLKILLEAFIRSADQVRGDRDQMAWCWSRFEAMCELSEPSAGRFDCRELALFGRMRARELWPAVHHSPTYNEAYDPVYRVLTRQEAETVCRKINVPFDVV